MNMFLQKVTKNSLSAFDEKRCYLNNIESMCHTTKFLYMKKFNLNNIFIINGKLFYIR